MLYFVCDNHCSSTTCTFGTNLQPRTRRAVLSFHHALFSLSLPPCPPHPGYAMLLFLAVCLATGLYYLAELIEEHTRLTRRVLLYAIRAVLAVHVVLLVWDRLPLLCVIPVRAPSLDLPSRSPPFCYTFRVRGTACWQYTWPRCGACPRALQRAGFARWVHRGAPAGESSARAAAAAALKASCAARPVL